jgi:hypothetical protein
MFGFPSLLYLYIAGSGAVSLLASAFTIWMLIECLRKDPDRYLWMWLILIMPGIGPVIYFFIRWLPGRNLRPPGWLRRLTLGSEIRRLESAALLIGNPHQHVQLGEALREIGHLERARSTYSHALAREPQNLTALWGVGIIDLQQKSFDSARNHLEKVMQKDPEFKFGDASLAYGKSLVGLGRTEDARTHLEKHVRRWRDPEGTCLLAQLEMESGLHEQARSHVRAMLVDFDCCPKAIARKNSRWRRRGHQLLRKLR